MIFSQSAIWNIAPLIKTNFDWSTSTRNHAQRSLYPWSETNSWCSSWLPSLPVFLPWSKLKKAQNPDNLNILKKSPPQKNIYKSGGAKLISHWRMYITICESRVHEFLIIPIYLLFYFRMELCCASCYILKVSWFQLFVYLIGWYSVVWDLRCKKNWVAENEF